MHKYNLNCKIRKTKSYITYIKFAVGQKTTYLSAIIDQASKEIVAYKVSNVLELPIVLDTLKNLEQNKNIL